MEDRLHMNMTTRTAGEFVTAIDAARRCFDDDNFARAEAICREILDIDAENTEAWNLLGIACCRAGRHEPGLAALRRALLLDGSRADIHMNLGNALRETGDVEHAEQCFRDAIALAPAYAQAHYNLGAALEEQGRTGQAQQSYLHALQIDPDLAEAHLNLGATLQAAGRRPEAKERYRQALRCNPRLVAAWRNLAAILEEEEQIEEAIVCCRRALEIAPDDGRTLYMLGLLLERLGYMDEAAAYVSRALKRVPQRDAVEMSVTLATMAPPVARSREHIAEVRRQIGHRLGVLAATGLRFDAERSALAPPFFLSYHGQCNREINGRLAALLQRMSPGLVWTAPHCNGWKGPQGRIRVGFLSRFLRNHSIGKTTRGFFPQLDRSQFESYALFLPPAADDEIARFIRSHADHAVTLPDTVTAARERIAALELDVLFYQDVAMESMSYMMSFARLAPVQCLSFGHPDTTGVPSMDYFVSSELFEPEEAQAHYSEKLFLLRDLGTLAYYYRPQLQQPPKSRAQLGLPRDAHLYVCPQTLFKLHPDIDALFAAILRADPRGRIVLIEGKYPQWAQWLRQRFAQTMPDVLERVIFLKQMGAADFINLLAVADVSLDTPHFNGMNTSLEAFAVGTPVVTLPGNFQRGRHTYGMYRKMGFEACIAGDAADYVRIALRLGTEPAWRSEVSRGILERCGVLFEDVNVVREFERFFVEAVAHARGAAPASRGEPPAAHSSETLAKAENDRGNQFAGGENYAEAEACYRRALVLAPDSATTLANLAHALHCLDRDDEAIACCHQALASNPGHAPALNVLGTIYRFRGRWDEAIDCYRKALDLDPRSLDVCNNLGITLLALRRLDEAGHYFDRALAIDPDRADAHWDRACLLLLQGDYARGWKEYEWRWIHDPDLRRQAGRYPQPRWRGEDPAGKTILLHTEQGLGDALQFIRYAPLLARRGARVLLSCPRPLQRLLAGVEGVAEVVDPGAIPHFDCHCPLLSLPLLFGTTLDSVPASIPYLAADPGLAASWAQRLPADGALRVGVVWTSNPHRYGGATKVARSKLSRACPGTALAPLAGVRGVRYFSLQKDPPPGDPPGLALTDCMHMVDDFADTAALIANLDMVISVDTSVLHVAGALGKPVWIMLPFDSEWRWLLTRDDSPWYPTARLFRQRVMGDWPQVIADVAAALRGVVARGEIGGAA